MWTRRYVRSMIHDGEVESERLAPARVLFHDHADRCFAEAACGLCKSLDWTGAELVRTTAAHNVEVAPEQAWALAAMARSMEVCVSTSRASSFA